MMSGKMHSILEDKNIVHINYSIFKLCVCTEMKLHWSFQEWIRWLMVLLVRREKVREIFFSGSSVWWFLQEYLFPSLVCNQEGKLWSEVYLVSDPLSAYRAVITRKDTKSLLKKLLGSFRKIRKTWSKDSIQISLMLTSQWYFCYFNTSAFYALFIAVYLFYVSLL